MNDIINKRSIGNPNLVQVEDPPIIPNPFQLVTIFVTLVTFVTLFLMCYGMLRLLQNICIFTKEEQYQGEFLIDLFVNILGYT